MPRRRNTVRERVLAHLATRRLLTSIREEGDRDRHELPVPAGFVEPDEAVAVPGILEQLEREGLVERSEEVHPFDSSEYQVTWRLATDESRGLRVTPAKTDGDGSGTATASPLKNELKGSP
jgi:hypothetical protein